MNIICNNELKADTYYNSLQIVFGTNFSNSKSMDNISLPPGWSNPFAYIVNKVNTGSNNALTSIYAPLLHVRKWYV